MFLFAALPQADLTPAQTFALERIGARELVRQRVPGFSIAVMRAGHVLFTKGYGYRDPARGLAATARTQYQVGSLTKQFTAAAVLLLAQEGRLRIDDPVSLYVAGVPNGESITLRQLLIQTSGLPNCPEAKNSSAGRERPTPSRLHERIAGRALQSNPGSRWAYNGTGYVVLGLAIERVAGVPYERFLQTRFFEPLGLSATSYRDASGDDVAAPYDASGPVLQALPAQDLSWAYASGGLWSSAQDVARWNDALAGGRVLEARWLAQMAATGHLSDGSATSYGMGLALGTVDGHRELWSNGALPGFAARNAIFPDDRLSIVVFGNAGQFDPEPVVREVLSVVSVPEPVRTAARVGARAREWLERLQQHEVDRAQLTAELRFALTPAKLDDIARTLGPLGQPKALVLQNTKLSGGVTAYLYRIDWERGSLGFSFALDDASAKVAGLFFQPVSP